MAAPPVSVGAVHDRLMVVRPEAVAVNPVGAPGAVAGAVVTLELVVQPLEPRALLALIL